MKRNLLLLAALLGVLTWTSPALAHGGSFRGPNGGVPPGLKEPHDPQPPPPPPSEGGEPGGTVTPEDPGAPGTSTPPSHDAGPDSGTAPEPTGPTGGPRPRGGARTKKTLTYESWRYWWAYNKDDILNLKSHVYARGEVSGNPLIFGDSSRGSRRNPTRPTQHAVATVILPALARRIDDPAEHEDIHGGALVARGKIGSGRDLALFKRVLWNEYRNERGTRIDFGRQATESAILAVGLLPGLDEAERRTAREICLAAIGDRDLHLRERCWAAVSLGLLRDREAVDALVEMLREGSVLEERADLPAAILLSLGLIGDRRVSHDLARAFLRRDLYGHRITDPRVHAFVGSALSKLADPGTLDAVLKVLRSRRFGAAARRSAAIAAGTIGSACDEPARSEAVDALLRLVTARSGDRTARNFAVIALSQIGTDRAIRGLLQVLERGRHGEAPFAALGLGTHVFYAARDQAEGVGDGVDADLLDRIRKALRRASEGARDTDTRAALYLARGLVRDRTAREEMTRVAAARGDPVLRGYCCVALGLLGEPRDDVRFALREALRDRKSEDLRRQAATGLALLRDAKVVDLLLQELGRAKSFAVKGQLITAIGTIGDHNAIAPLVRILEDKGRHKALTRAMAAVGLGMIGDLRPVPALSRVSKNYNYRASVPELDELLFIL